MLENEGERALLNVIAMRRIRPSNVPASASIHARALSNFRCIRYYRPVYKIRIGDLLLFAYTI